MIKTTDRLIYGNKYAGRRSFRAVAARIFLLSLVCAVLMPLAAGAQDRKIRLAKDSITVEALLREIEKQTGLLLAINHSGFDMRRQLATGAGTKGLSELMDMLVKDTEQAYVFSGRHIIIIPRREQEQPAIPVTEYYNIEGVLYNNPDFEDDVRSYNEGRAAQERTGKTVYVDSLVVRVVEAPDSVFTYPGVTRAFAARPGKYPRTGRQTVSSPKLAVKVNMLYGAAALTPNLSLEIGTGRRSSLDIAGSYNPWGRKGTREDNDKLVHWVLRPEFRLWLCERFSGHFFGAHAFYWQYNVSGRGIPLMFRSQYRYEGNAWGVGVSYGYSWIWSRRWGMEFNVGAGVALMDYDRYPCQRCMRDVKSMKKTYLGPTSLGIKLVYNIK